VKSDSARLALVDNSERFRVAHQGSSRTRRETLKQLPNGSQMKGGFVRRLVKPS